jgi:hypothetical protein
MGQSFSCDHAEKGASIRRRVGMDTMIHNFYIELPRYASARYLK